MILDEKSPVALYHQLKDKLVEKIKNNEWQVDTKIPTERELCNIYKVSRMTVRLALGELQKEGYLYRKQGKGTFITTPKIEQRLQNFYSFSEEIRKMSMIPGTLILSFNIQSCPDDVADALKIDPGVSVYRIQRLRLADSEPFALETSYIPCELCPGLTTDEVEEEGLYNSLHKRAGIIVREAEESFEAVIINAESARLLKSGKNSPGLLLKRIAGDNGRTVEFCTSIIRGDRFKYKVVLK